MAVLSENRWVENWAFLKADEWETPLVAQKDEKWAGG